MKHKNYTIEQQLKVITEMEASGCTYQEMSDKINVPIPTIQVWMDNKDKIKAKADYEIKKRLINPKLIGQVPKKIDELKHQLAHLDIMIGDLLVPAREQIKDLLQNPQNIDRVTRNLQSLVIGMDSVFEKRQSIIDSVELLNKVNEAMDQQRVTIEELRQERELQRLAEMALVAWAKQKAMNHERITSESITREIIDISG